MAVTDENNYSLPNNVLNILLVDDDDDDCSFFAEALESLKFPCSLSIVNSCKNMFTLLDEGKTFDIVFLDLNMPMVSGKQCLTLLKTNPQYKDIPIIIFTSSKYAPDIDDCYQSGAHYHMVKPYSQLNYVESLKVIFNIDWKKKPPVPPRDNFLINFTFN